MCDLNFGPLVTAVVTPFDDKGRVDLVQFETLLARLLAHHSTAILATGTTGEAATLNSIEKLHIWEKAVDFIDGQMPVVVGIGTNNTKTTIHNAKLAEEAEADALLVVVPYYSKPSQKGLLKHFKSIAAHTKLPIILYNNPSRCGTGLTVMSVVELAQIPNIVGIKEASNDAERLAQLKKALPDDFLLYTGDDPLYLETLKLGGAGAISVASHLIGKKMKNIYDVFLAGKLGEAEALQAQNTPVYETLCAYPNPSPVKALLTRIGVDVGGVRLPLVALEEKETQALWEEIEAFIDA